MSDILLEPLENQHSKIELTERKYLIRHSYSICLSLFDQLILVTFKYNNHLATGQLHSLNVLEDGNNSTLNLEIRLS